jgi:putative ABC transport system ATP-binding protein
MAPGTDGSAPVVSARGLVKEYRRGDVVVRALDDVDLHVESGTFLAIVGPSGSGKSTLLHLLSALDRPTSGEVAIAGRRLSERSDDELSDLRRDEVGFVFQFFNLLPTLSAWENVALPATFGGARLGPLRHRAVELLDRVGMADRVEHRPAELSGGQLQRVAIARALVASPSLVVADEPTGNLDSAAGVQVLDLLSELVNEGTTMVMVTHSDEAAARADRVVQLRDGRLVGDETGRARVGSTDAATRNPGVAVSAEPRPHAGEGGVGQD